ncbi:MAG: hypothetical protein HC882_02230, partial [Acidobacteria bacterium]|nr:hypothetical protein [Acidobacteriota bacterium]
ILSRILAEVFSRRRRASRLRTQFATAALARDGHDQPIQCRDRRRSFELTYRDSDPDLTAKVVNALAALYIEENTALRTRQAGATAETLRGLAEDVSRQLQTQEAILSEFRARHLYELESHLPANLALLKSRQDEMMVNTRLIEDAELRLESLQRSKRLEANGGELASPSARPKCRPTCAAPTSCGRSWPRRASTTRSNIRASSSSFASWRRWNSD